MSVNLVALLETLVDKRVRITLKNGTSLVCEPIQLVFDSELETYHVYVIEGQAGYRSESYANVYTPDIDTIEELT